jgi:hypothetical protein
MWMANLEALGMRIESKEEEIVRLDHNYSVFLHLKPLHRGSPS